MKQWKEVHRQQQEEQQQEQHQVASELTETKRSLQVVQMERLRLTGEVVDSEEEVASVERKLTQQVQRHEEQNVLWDSKKQQWEKERKGLMEVRNKDLNRSQYIRPYCKTGVHYW